MAKRNNGGSSAASRKAGVQRQTAGGDGSLILRSAESLGRMIGALQRQLDTVADQAKPAPAMKKRTAPTRKTTSVKKNKSTSPKKNRKATKRAQMKRATKR